MAELNFAILEPTESTMSFDPLPDGWYSAVVVEEEKRESAAGKAAAAPGPAGGDIAALIGRFSGVC